MRAVIQRVSCSTVSVGGQVVGETGVGLVVLLGIEDADTQEDITWLAGKIARIRIFDDAEGLMNQSLTDVGGDILVVSQFTLHASTKKGNRPSYTRAARPEAAEPLPGRNRTIRGRHAGVADERRSGHNPDRQSKPRMTPGKNRHRKELSARSDQPS